MEAKKILFPTDFSPASEAALPLAMSLARDTGATLVMVHVIEPPAVYSAGDFAIGVPAPADVTRESLEAMRVPDPNIPVERRVIDGEPGRAILELANTLGVDLIVMGTHGRSGIRRLLMGSVAEEVLRGAKCPVLTYRHPIEGES
ncbi:MAG: universal stress protein [Pirellulales bacterium]